MSSIVCHLNTWKRFIKDGVLDPSRLNKRITESWYRCKKQKVDPYLNKGQLLLANELLEAQRKKSSELMGIAAPHLAKMDPFLRDAGMMALLVDSEGYVLSITGNEQVQSDAKRINFVEGVCWTEEQVGTNAIGTALQTGEPVLINGTEHFSVASHGWSCSATPIFDPSKKLLGILDISCPIQLSHPLMMGMVASTVHAIEKELSLHVIQQEAELVREAMEWAERYRDRPFVVCNRQQIIISASKPVRDKIPQSIGMKMTELVLNGFEISGQHVRQGVGSTVSQTGYFLKEERRAKKGRLSTGASQASTPFIFKGEAGESQAFQATLQKVKHVAPAEANVHIKGESGTGKELIARAIHENSSRKSGPFLAINCGAIPKDLMESELFGYVEGAFTGAKRQGYKGKFEQANHGTIFLDEIGEIPPSMQVALLRILQERKVMPIGGMKEADLNIRVISATHRDLFQLVQEGRFREDLYYRLQVYPIDIPPLRERKEDIPDLVRHVCQKNGWEIPCSSLFFNRLREYSWPGNIRELENIIERMYILLQGKWTDQQKLMDCWDSLNLSIPKGNSASTDVSVQSETKCKLSIREKIQKDLMIEALHKTQGNVTAAAKLIDIPRSTFYKRLQRYGL